MKFLCDHCKAKYQIADEKVAGKTIRMKCRKCGHDIEVRSAVTESSVARGAPQPPRAASTLATSLSTTKPRSPSAPLASALQRNVEDDSAVSSAGVGVGLSDEWYAAINGVPVGPIRMTELRRKAAAGAVNDDSLVWQEGMDEWRPVATIPELAEVLREAALGNRPSLLPDAGRASMPPRPPAPPPPPARPATPAPPRAAAARPIAPSAPAVAARSNVVPFVARGGAAERLSEDAFLDAAPIADPFATEVSAPPVADPFAPPPPGPREPFGAPAVVPAPAAAPPAGADPFALPVAAAAADAFVARPAAASLAAAPTAPKRGVPLWFLAVTIPLTGFLVTAAVFIFRPKETPATVIIQQTAPTAPASAQPSEPAPPATAPTPEPVASVATQTAPQPGTKTHGASQPAAAPEASRRTADLSGLLGGSGHGPSLAGGGSGGGSSGGGLDAASVQSVVRQRQAGVKRTCWERGADGKSSVNVTVSVKVAPNGTVQDATSTGDDPVVGKCIANQVKTWVFPAPGATTTVNIPFHFVRQ